MAEWCGPDEDPNGLPAHGTRTSRRAVSGRTKGPHAALGGGRYAAPVIALPALRRPSTSRSAGRVGRAALHGLVVGGLVFLVFTFAVAAPRVGTVGYDAFAYWSVQLPHPYEAALGALGAFTYSPPMALLFDLATGLEWWVFLWVWLAILLATAIWLGGRRALIVLAFPPVIMELYYGNVNLLIGAAIVLGFRHPWTWSFVLLTKPSCGVGLLWFVVRREWRQLGVALGSTAAIVAVSFVIAPQLWQEWISFLMANASGTPGGAWVPIPLWLRGVAAVGIVVWGARTDRTWTVPIASAVAMPVLWFAGFAILAALVRVPKATPVAHRTRTAAPSAAIPDAQGA
jgi:hypothetical protein